MPEIQGGFGITGTDSSRQLSIQTSSAVDIFNNISVLQTDPFARALGIYGDVVLGRELEGRFLSFNTPKHMLRARQNGCTWNPTTGLRMGIDTFP
ncbi:MAG: hypothetical protein ACRCVX_14930, partial [Shewanella sp.]